MGMVISASVYVDFVTTPEDATKVVEELNDAVMESGDANLQIVLPYPPNEPGSSKWEPYDDENE